MAHWQAGWAMAMDHPLVGVGPGNYDAAYGQYSFPGWIESLGHAHNYYINEFAEIGVIGLAAIVGLFIVVFARIGRGIMLTGQKMTSDRLLLLAMLGATVGFCVHNTFDNMFVHEIGLQFALLLGCTEVIVRGLQGDR